MGVGIESGSLPGRSPGTWSTTLGRSSLEPGSGKGPVGVATGPGWHLSDRWSHGARLV